MPQIIKFGCLVGLRSSEIIESVRFINDKEAFPRYYDPQTQTLNHWKMPGMIRNTKKAFLSFITPSMLDIGKNIKNVPSWGAIRLSCRRRGLPMDMRFARKIHASWLIQSGIDSNTVDMLQGRVPRSVLMQHYVTPNSDLKEKVLKSVDALAAKIN